MKTTRTWILIADGGRARVLENPGPGKGARQVDGLMFEADLPPTHDIVADRQGRSFESSDSTRHPLTPPSDPRERLKHDFLAGLVETLSQRLDAGAYDKLLVVAPPSALGELRKLLPAKLQAVLAGEIGKDLTKTPDHDLAPHLADVLKL